MSRGDLRLNARAWALACVVSALSALTSGEARAQGNYRSTPIGGRSALMGGTGYALGRDGSSPFLNPATIVNVADTGLAFSVNFYSFSSTHLSNFHQPGALDRARFGNLDLPDTSLQQNKVDALPSTLCLFLDVPNVGGIAPKEHERKHRQRLALCLGYTERQESSVSASRYTGASAGIQSDQSVSLSRKWNRFHVGPTYSVYVTEDVALGLSIHGMNTTYAQAWGTTTVSRDANGRAITSSYDNATDAFSLDMSAVAGLLWRPDAHHFVGVGVTTPALHVASRYDATFSTQYDASASAAGGAGGAGGDRYALLRTAHDGSFFAPPPLRVGAGFGAAYGKWRIEVDASYSFARDEGARANVIANEIEVKNGVATATTKSLAITQKTDAIVNGAFGVEYFVSPSISVLGGASTDFSAIPAQSETPSETSIAQGRLHRVATSLGIGSYGPGTELLFGAELSYGWGRSFAVDSYVLPPRLTLVTQDTLTAMFIIAGSTSLNTLRSTVDRLGEMVKIK